MQGRESLPSIVPDIGTTATASGGYSTWSCGRESASKETSNRLLRQWWPTPFHSPCAHLSPSWNTHAEERETGRASLPEKRRCVRSCREQQVAAQSVADPLLSRDIARRRTPMEAGPLFSTRTAGAAVATSSSDALFDPALGRSSSTP